MTANAWFPRDILKRPGTQSVGASETNTVVSRDFSITASGALNMVIAITTADTTVTNAITAKLQTNVAGVIDSWEDSKTVSITGNDTFYIKLQSNASADQTHLPLGTIGRVVVTSGAEDAASITALAVVQPN